MPEQPVNAHHIIHDTLAAYLVPNKRYPQPLPPPLARWYCYTTDGGHCIVVVLKSAWDTHRGDGTPITDYLVPAPVKTVLRTGYTETPDGFLICDLPYDDDLGLITQEGDDEY